MRKLEHSGDKDDVDRIGFSFFLFLFFTKNNNNSLIFFSGFLKGKNDPGAEMIRKIIGIQEEKQKSTSSKCYFIFFV